MTVWAAIAGIATTLAFITHVVMGSIEFWRCRPNDEEDVQSIQAWVQGLAGWQFASVDLLIASVVFLLIAFADLGMNNRLVMQLLAAYFAMVGTSWLLVVAKFGKGLPKRFLSLGQWIFCYAVAMVAFVGSIG